MKNRLTAAIGSLRRSSCCALALGLILTLGCPPAQAEFDPRAHTDLNQVILLCATEPGSPRFQAAWKDWLGENPHADVAGAVETVISRSATLRSMAVPAMAPTASGQRPDPEALAAQMFSLAGLPVPG